MPSDQNRNTETQIERNRVTRGDWESFAPHRRIVTDLILSAASESQVPTLCILGAGNGNDLDLELLLETFAKICLVDLDSQALSHCTDRVAGHVGGRIEVQPAVDVSGILPLLEQLSPQVSATDEQVKELVSCAGEVVAPGSPARYDVVVSTCLLTQLIDSVVTSMGDQHPQLADVVIAVRDAHLRLISDLIAPGGVGLLITDFVSSDTLPELNSVSDRQLFKLVRDAIDAGNFFTGVNPAVLQNRFPLAAGDGLQTVARMHPPWRWQMGNRAYAVCAVEVRRHA